MPSPMVPQLQFIRNELTGLMGFKNISLPNTEADDLMGCYAIAAARRGYEVILATNDKDLFQLVNDKVKVYTTAKADLATPKDTYALLGEDEVVAKWDVPPNLIGDVLAIAGDSVDNIPGAGIGRKAAAALLKEHGGLEALLNDLSKVKSLRSREKLTAARDQILQNRKMVELDCDTELPVPLDDLRITPDYPALLETLERWEIKSILQELREEQTKAGTVHQAELLL
jgi:DNA polymerase-1